MPRFSTRLLAIVALAFSLTLLALTTRAHAAERAYRAKGTAQFVSPTEFVGSGNATHLGRYSERGQVAFTPTPTPGVLRVQGEIVYTAANGDELRAAVAGELNGLTGVVTATLTYHGGTGRFATATGSSSLTGQAGPAGALTVSVAGTIDY